MHGQCDARPTVTFPAAEHHRPLTGNKLYCLVTEAQLAQGCYLTARGLESNTGVQCNVNVEFKVTLHEQVRCRGTLQ